MAKFTLTNVEKICKDMFYNIVMLNWEKRYSTIKSLLVVGIAKFTGSSEHQRMWRAGSGEICGDVTRGVRRYIWAARYGGKGGSVHRVYAVLWKINLVVGDVHRISAYSPAAKRRMRRKTRLREYTLNMSVFIQVLTVKEFFRIAIESCITMSVRYLAGTENVQLVSGRNVTVGILPYKQGYWVNALCPAWYCTCGFVLLQMDVCIALVFALHVASAYRVKGWCQVGSMGKCKNEFN